VKITDQLADNVYVCADDALIVSDYVRHFRIQLGQPTTVKSAANFVSSLPYNNKAKRQTGRIVLDPVLMMQIIYMCRKSITRSQEDTTRMLESIMMNKGRNQLAKITIQSANLDN